MADDDPNGLDDEGAGPTSEDAQIFDDLTVLSDQSQQETLEEAARNYRDLKLPDDLYDGFIAGAKWQQERMEKLKDFDTWKEWKNKSE